MAETIFALSSGQPPAAIAIVRISGPQALAALAQLAGRVPEPRTAALQMLRGGDGAVLDQAVVLSFPGPNSATGEDLVELHLHGGRAVVRAVESALAQIAGLRAAEAGEFTRRAFANGRIDLGQAEALSDLLSAETEWQRRAAIDMAGSGFGRQVEQWRQHLLQLSAMVEAELDFSDEDDVASEGQADDQVAADALALANQLSAEAAKPTVERLRDGLRVVLAGPPNAGKSSLINALAQRDAAIVSDMAGTTRDVVEVPIALGGLAFVLSDTAGLRDSTDDAIEKVGIQRAQAALDRADIILWLGERGHGPVHAALIEIDSKADLGGLAKGDDALPVSAVTGDGLRALQDRIVALGKTLVPRPGDYALNARQRDELRDAANQLEDAAKARDLLLRAEHLRLARLAFDRLTGRTHTEHLLDHIFCGFCIGK